MPFVNVLKFEHWRRSYVFIVNFGQISHDSGVSTCGSRIYIILGGTFLISKYITFSCQGEVHKINCFSNWEDTINGTSKF